MRKLIRQARVVLPAEIVETSVLIDGSRIADIDPALHAKADEIIDGSGCYLIPGVIDDQVHFREPGLTHKEELWTASHACAKGGVTTFLEMPNTRPATTSQQLLVQKLELAAQKVS
jgi:dihydroorotase